MKLNIPIKSARDGQVSAERLVNCYAEEADGRADVQVLSVPGMSLFATTGSGVGRGLGVHADVLYTVVGSKLYRITSAGGSAEIGNIAGSGMVQFASSGDELVIASDGFSYVYDGVTLSALSDEDFEGANCVDYLDGYFIFSNSLDTFQISALYAGGTIDALDFATAESNPDPILRAFVDHRELLLFGSKTVETWVNTGDADFPFERLPGGITEKGLSNRNAVARLDNSVMWVDHEGVVRRMAAGYLAQRISTHDIESRINLTSECFAFTWNGHEFFVLSTDDVTFIYDAATQLWHERKSQGETRWRAQGHAFCYSKHFVGDFENGNIYELSDDVFAEAGDDLITEFVFPVLHSEGARFRLHKLQLDMEMGEAPFNTEPVVRLDLSDDGAEWRTAGTSTLGLTGSRKNRTVFRRLGQHRYLHMRIIISDPCKRALYNAYAEVSDG